MLGPLAVERKTKMKPTIEEIYEASSNYEGWCTSCEDFTTGCCEPDAREYECEVCGENTVYGAEEAVIMGLIE